MSRCGNDVVYSGHGNSSINNNFNRNNNSPTSERTTQEEHKIF